MGVSQEVLDQAGQLDPGYTGQIIRIRCSFAQIDQIQGFLEDSITLAIRGAFALIPGWTLNNVIYPVVNQVKECHIIIVRKEQ